jgi:hypothetical protein
MKALITTTVNVPHNLSDWADHLDEDDHIIVAGDMKTPQTDVDDLLNHISMNTGVVTTYLTPREQEKWKSSDVIGWNSIQRRNIALLEAIALKPDWIITVNDDGFPTMDRQLSAIIDRCERLHKTFSSNTEWWNPGSQNYPPTVHRGMPMSQRHVQHLPTPNEEYAVGVAEMLIVGDPDVDAVERICHNPQVEFISTDIRLAPGTWAPFNSEATLIRGELAPLLFQWPGVGRYDDIWCSYLARCVMDHFGWAVYYGDPPIRQERNAHNLLADLDAELFGMQHTEELVQVLRDVRLHKAVTVGTLTVTQAMIYVLNIVLSRCAWIPLQTRDSFYAWFADLETIGFTDFETVGVK